MLARGFRRKIFLRWAGKPERWMKKHPIESAELEIMKARNEESYSGSASLMPGGEKARRK
jgi:hypothetical protein